MCLAKYLFAYLLFELALTATLFSSGMYSISGGKTLLAIFVAVLALVWP